MRDSEELYTPTGLPIEVTDGSVSSTMGTLGVARIVLRWSFVVVPLASLSLFLAATQARDIQPEYTAEVAVLLVGGNELEIYDPDTEETRIEVVNPLNLLGGSLSTVASVTAIAMSDGEIEDQLEDEGLSTGINVWVESRTPIINVEAVDSDRQIASDTATRVVELIALNLEERQNALGAPDSDRIFAQQIHNSTVGGADYGGRNRVLIAFAAVGLALSVATAFLLEGATQLLRRYQRRGSQATSELEIDLTATSDRQTPQAYPVGFETDQLRPTVQPRSTFVPDEIAGGVAVAQGKRVHSCSSPTTVDHRELSRSGDSRDEWFGHLQST